MATYLLCSSPIYGHVMPLLEVGRHLAGQGHNVRILTGARFEEKARAAGLQFTPLPAECDFDDRDIDASFPGRAGKKGVARLRYDMTEVFIKAMPYQYRALKEQLAREPTDSVLVEFAFAGAALLIIEGAPRPPVLAAGVIPLSLSSRDTAPFGLGLPPMPGLRGTLRNLALNTLTRSVVFRPNQLAANKRSLSTIGKPLPVFFLDWSRIADKFLQFTCPGFEYPRTDLPDHVSFTGPVISPAEDNFNPPPWWQDLQGERPVVHVTQGTIDNRDLTRLILPTLKALANMDVLAVATTGGGRLEAAPGEVPANARVADFIPYGELLPHVDVVVTNGGYGGVQQVLAQGLPLIVAGETEDKRDVAARVAWSGAGINLRTGTPTPEALATAVKTVLDDPSYRMAAQRLAREFAQYSALPAIERELETATARRAWW
jgi:UDP:flavonoid glycosyltransferase YjiC (YdhE family)